MVDMMKNSFLKRHGFRILTLVSLSVLIVGASLELWNIPWGKGFNGAPLSWKWALMFLFLLAISLAFLILILLPLWSSELYTRMVGKITALRARLGIIRLALIPVVILFPCWLFGYNIYGVLLTGTALHLLVWGLSASVVGFLLTKEHKNLLDQKNLLIGLLLTGTGFTLAFAFREVTDYPFSLYWSEGNRIWDYSLFFGRERYIYPADEPIFSYIDLGRQFLWGLPFLLPKLDITGFRFWNSLMFVLPYLLFGLIVMHYGRRGTALWFLAGAWTFLYLYLGAVYSTLIISAILVALGWKRSLWISIPLLVLAGLFVSLSRWTWVFAPAIWIGMLEFCGAELRNGKLGRRAWLRSILLAFAGLVGSLFTPLKTALSGLIYRLSLIPGVLYPAVSVSAHTAAPVTGGSLPPMATATPVPDSSVFQNLITDQPLLWYRLLPNKTYPPGILLGLLIAVGPLLVLLLYILVTSRWKISFLQKMILGGALLAFLSVGLVASVKIGGGSNLHNLDMFIIALLFTAVLAWQKGPGKELFVQGAIQPVWVRVVLFLLVIIPAFQSVIGLQPLHVRLDYEKISGLLPPYFDNIPDEYSQIVLDAIRDAVAVTQLNGDVLFMDQRQLLTFGYVQNVPLVADYEKKYMMDMALSGNAEYFAGYYRALAEQRFSLIIAEPMLINYEAITEKNFAEENNNWVRWVSEPTLCFYQPFLTYDDVQIQLLIPRDDISGCIMYLDEAQP